jgi:hypothetical protein
MPWRRDVRRGAPLSCLRPGPTRWTLGNGFSPVLLSAPKGTLSQLAQAPQAAVELALHGPRTPKPRPHYRGPGWFDLRSNGGPNRTRFQPLEALVRDARFRRAKRKSAARSPRRLQLVHCDSAGRGLPHARSAAKAAVKGFRARAFCLRSLPANSEGDRVGSA